jgi:hypothetical protein
MKIRILILSFALLFGSTGCEPFTTTSILGTLGGVGMGVNKYVDYKLTKRSLDLKEREIKLKEKQFKKTSELNERLDTVENFMRYFPKQFKDLGDVNESEI